MFGVWSLQINSRMVAPQLPDHKIMHKYFAIQLVLILYKLQPVLLHGIAYGIKYATDYQINSKIIENGKIHHFDANYLHIINIIVIIIIMKSLRFFSHYSINYSNGNHYLVILCELCVQRAEQSKRTKLTYSRNINQIPNHISIVE